MANEFVRIPPDSTGKRVRHTRRLDIELTNVQVALTDIGVGTTITGDSSGTTATFVGNANDYGNSYIYVEQVNGSFSVGENISSSTNGVIGEIVSTQQTFTPLVGISDENSPNNTLKVSDKGSAFVRFTGGEMVFDAFGHSQFTQPQVVDQHTFLYEDLPKKYFTDERNGGSVQVNPTASMLVLSTGTTSGSYAGRTSNRYYPYTAGEGTEFIISLMSGDQGKDGVVRRWGLFDDKDGLFFELSGSVLSANQRNSASGTVNTIKVEQSDMNGDQLNDLAVSDYLLDESKLNLFWIDYQWLGVGRVRFGVIGPDGDRTVMHTFKNANKNVLPFAKRGTLPFRLEQFNEKTVGSTSEMKMVCASIIRQGSKESFKGKPFSGTSKLVEISGSEDTPLISFRPRQTFGGQENRISFIPTSIEVAAVGDTIDLHITTNPVLSGSTWTAPTQSNSSVEIDNDATSYSTSSVTETLDHQFHGPNFSAQRTYEEDIANALSLTADGQQPIYMLSATALEPSGSANVAVTVRWKEVR